MYKFHSFQRISAKESYYLANFCMLLKKKQPFKTVKYYQNVKYHQNVEHQKLVFVLQNIKMF